MQTLAATGHPGVQIDLADQLFEVSYIVAVKERAWRRVAVFAAVVGLTAGWVLAHVFSPSLDILPADALMHYESQRKP